MRSNCIFFAYALKWRRKKKGKQGYTLWRDCRIGKGPHAMYGELRKNGLVRVVSYTPVDQSYKKWPTPWFTGKVKWGDKDVRCTDDIHE